MYVERWWKIACKSLLFFQWYKKLFCPGGSVRCFTRLLNRTPPFASQGNCLSLCNCFVFNNLFAYNLLKCLWIRETFLKIQCSQNALGAVKEYCSRALAIFPHCDLHYKIKKALKINGSYPNLYQHQIMGKFGEIYFRIYLLSGRQFLNKVVLSMLSSSTLGIILV